ncbi:MAG TPA: HD domain-containing protein [Gemmataceae bacterium]|nr:HD domain-containing protein [Gemmataceae bacterium]
MAREKPAVVRLSELTPGQAGDFFALLIERTKGMTRDGKPYYTCRFRDAVRTVASMVWADSPWYDECEQQWQEGQFYKVRGRYTEHERYGAQIEIQKIRPVKEEDEAEGFNPADFVEHSRYNPDQMFAELRGLAETHIADGPLRELVLKVLDRHAEPLKKLPATQGKFYPFMGGLLEHTLAVTRICVQLAERYAAHYPGLQPPLNRDLVTAGAILHDIGRVAEFGDDAVAVQPTVPGRLFGHLFLGRDLVRDAAREIGTVNRELLELLEHIIISHLNLPEWGSPRLPLIPEALIIHHADDLDAKLEMYVRCLSRDLEDGPFTARDPVLGRQLYKGRKV